MEGQAAGKHVAGRGREHDVGAWLVAHHSSGGYEFKVTFH